MTYTFKLSRRLARFRAPVFAAIVLTLGGCNTTDSLDPDSGPPSTQAPALASASFAGGIPIGLFAQPTSEFGARYNGAMENIWPNYLLDELAAIKARGGKTILMMAGSQENYKNADGTFSLTKWKARIDRFKTVNFSAYVSDGTLIGHFLIDEPNDPANWAGQPISPATVEEMAKYSKQLWPNLATIARVAPSYLTGSHPYLDAAWAQYLSRWGDVNDYIRRNVADAQSRGLALVVGLNVLKGGTPNGTKMTASQVESWGSALLSSTYPCAFISWTYDDGYLSGAGVPAAMDVLRGKAENRSTKNCRGSATAPAPEPDPTPTPEPTPTPAGGTLPFGVSFAPVEAYSTRWTGTVYRATPTDLVARLDRAAGAGMKVIVMLAAAAQSKNADGTFSLANWKAQVDRYRGLPLDSYISSKTLYLHNLVDQPSCASCWGGQVIPWETVEEMARYSKSIWPAIPTTARVAPAKLAEATFRWTYLDAGWAQYNTKAGDLRTYLANQAAQAQAEGLGLVVGLNLLDGSGLDTAPMTPSQIEEFGTILAQSPSVCALAGWKYDASYLSQTGIGEALDSVAAVARRRAPASCVVS